MEGLLSVIAILLALILLRLLNKDGVTYAFGCVGAVVLLVTSAFAGYATWAFTEQFVPSNIIRTIVGVAVGVAVLRILGKALEFAFYLLAPDFMARQDERESKRAAFKIKVQREREKAERLARLSEE